MSSNHDQPKKTATKAAGKSKTKQPPREQEMGEALRSVWQRTVDEHVPADMMDLLGKLG